MTAPEERGRKKGKAMAEVTIAPGRTGVSQAIIRLLSEDFKPLEAQKVTLFVTPPKSGSASTTLVAAEDADGAWKVDGRITATRQLDCHSLG
jgi:copper transport protein